MGLLLVKRAIFSPAKRSALCVDNPQRDANILSTLWFTVDDN